VGRETHIPVPRSKRVYFPGLNALRFYAATSVVIAHISHNFGEMRTRPAHYPLLNALTLDAQSAVNLFFVLSGFLITYLLLEEQSETGAVSVRQFYVRRILRIWPLYYLTAFVGFGALPILLGPTYALWSPPALKVILVLFLLANLASPLGPLQHLWSIGLEEQFYLVWPWVVRRPHSFLRVVGGILILKVVLAPVVEMFNSDAMTQLFLGLRFECMSIGALGAYLYFRKSAWLKLVYSPLARVIALVGIVILALVDVSLTEPMILLTSIVFIVLILNMATNERSWITLETPVLNKLGQMSYGIYMYHYPLLYVVIFILRSLSVQEGDAYSLILYVTTICGTLVLATVSYRWFEMPFLQLKTRFAVIQSER
jgi:peptidoglycan/LPS O-acetylase OafA/YrhL